jgi:hypothetical protein
MIMTGPGKTILRCGTLGQLEPHTSPTPPSSHVQADPDTWPLGMLYGGVSCYIWYRFVYKYHMDSRHTIMKEILCPELHHDERKCGYLKTKLY